MPDFRIHETAPEHAKLRAAGPAAVGVWAMAGAYAMREMTDGWVPAYWVETWPQGRRHATTLVRLGLWVASNRLGIAGFAFLDWLDYQRSSAEIDADRYAATARRSVYSSPSVAAAVKSRDGNHCRYCGREVSWANRRGTSGATVDHVTPILHGGRTVVDNLVVACRGCAAAKRARTPEQAGMTVRPPPETDQFGSSSGSRSELDGSSKKNSSPIPIPSSGKSGGVSPVALRARENEPPLEIDGLAFRPSDRCARHRDDPTDRPCRACRAARIEQAEWDRLATLGAVMADRGCPHCDADGWRYVPGRRVPITPYVRCDHLPEGGIDAEST